MSEFHWHGCAKDVEIYSTGLTVITEAIALLATGITVEYALRVGWFWEEGKNMVVLVEGMSDILRHLRTFLMQKVVAHSATVYDS